MRAVRRVAPPLDADVGSKRNSVPPEVAHVHHLVERAETSQGRRLGRVAVPPAPFPAGLAERYAPALRSEPRLELLALAPVHDVAVDHAPEAEVALGGSRQVGVARLLAVGRDELRTHLGKRKLGLEARRRRGARGVHIVREARSCSAE